MNISRLSLALCAFVFLAQARHVHAGPREDFDRLVQEAQAAPADDKLRERIIAAALALKPAPAVPIEARRHMSRAQGAIELAKQPEDMRLAVEELEKALRLAPWWAEAYYNLGVVQDKAGRYGDAVRSLRLYLRTAPGAKDAQDVEMQIAKLEFKAEQSSPAAKASRERQGFDALVKALDGKTFRGERFPTGTGYFEIRVKDGVATVGNFITDPETRRDMDRNNPQRRGNYFIGTSRVRMAGFDTSYEVRCAGDSSGTTIVSGTGRLILSRDGRKFTNEVCGSMNVYNRYE